MQKGFLRNTNCYLKSVYVEIYLEMKRILWFWSISRIQNMNDVQNGSTYRTLHSYKLIWTVCHLFPQQRWRTHKYSVSGNHWPGEPRDPRKTTSARKFRPAFGATSKTRIFYKYVVFKHSFSFSQVPLQRWHTLSTVWHSSIAVLWNYTLFWAHKWITRLLL